MPKKTIDNIPGSYYKRVFIGGDYSQRALITEIEEIVSNLGFIPVVADEYEMKEEEIHDCTMRLLHCCKYAIFDISTISGALMEIERIRDYKTKALIVFSSRVEKGIPKQQTTRMIDPALRPRGYRNFTQLNRIIENFLAVQEHLINFIVLSGALEIATGEKPDILEENFARKYRDLNSGIIPGEALVSYIFDKHYIRPPKVRSTDFVNKIYKTVLRRSPSQNEIKNRVYLLLRGYRTRAQLFIDTIYSEENLQRIANLYKFLEFKRRKGRSAS